jgi:hypothetical protein
MPAIWHRNVSSRQLPELRRIRTRLDSSDAPWAKSPNATRTMPNDTAVTGPASRQAAHRITERHSRPPNQLALVAPSNLPHIMLAGPMADSFWLSQVRSRISPTTDSAALRVPHSTTKNQYSTVAAPSGVSRLRGAAEETANTTSSRPTICTKRNGVASSQRLRSSSGFMTRPAQNKHLPGCAHLR